MNKKNKNKYFVTIICAIITYFFLEFIFLISIGSRKISLFYYILAGVSVYWIVGVRFAIIFSAKNNSTFFITNFRVIQVFEKRKFPYKRIYNQIYLKDIDNIAFFERGIFFFKRKKNNKPRIVLEDTCVDIYIKRVPTLSMDFTRKKGLVMPVSNKRATATVALSKDDSLDISYKLEEVKYILKEVMPSLIQHPNLYEIYVNSEIYNKYISYNYQNISKNR